MTKYEKIEKEAGEMQSYLDIECSDNPEEILERLRKINVYQSRNDLPF